MLTFFLLYLLTRITNFKMKIGMKTKLIISLMALLMLCDICTQAQVKNLDLTSSEASTIKKGDINEDGEVDAADIVALVKIIMKGDGYNCEDGSLEPLPAITSAKVSDIFYSDGTCSSVLVSGKTPIGIVVYVGSGDVSENMHGLVMALNDAGKAKWYYNNELIPNSEIPIVSTVEGLIADMEGLAKSSILRAHKHDTMTCIDNYNVSAPAGTSGWFFPSAGQWIAVLNEYGASITKDTQFNVYSGGSVVLESINSALSKIGGVEGKDYTVIGHKYGSGQDGFYWTSSKSNGGRNSYSPVELFFSAQDGVRIGNSGSDGSALFIRPFLAF